MNDPINLVGQLIQRVVPQFRPIAPGIKAVTGVFPQGFLAIQTTREGGVSQPPFGSFNLAGHVGDDPQALAQNRKRLEKYCATFPVWLNQVHGIQVADLDAPRLSDGPPQTVQADAAISNQPGRVCAILTADCLPILVAREHSRGFAAIHAGWRGLCAGVVEQTLSAMLARDPRPDCWSFWLGPCIGPDAFEVGAEVRRAFLEKNAAADQGFRPLADAGAKYLADLRLLAEQRIGQWFASRPHALLTIGSGREGPLHPDHQPIRIGRSDECTVSASQRYFSFRRERETGRMASLITRLSI